MFKTCKDCGAAEGLELHRRGCPLTQYRVVYVITQTHVVEVSSDNPQNAGLLAEETMQANFDDYRQVGTEVLTEDGTWEDA